MKVINIMDNFLITIKNGTLCHQKENENIICDRCFKNNVKAYINFLHNDLCLQCVDTITEMNEQIKINIKHNQKPLTRMAQIIYNNMQQNVPLQFAILEKISDNEFKVMINHSIQILTSVKIANKFWNYLSEGDRAYFIKYLT
jgi:hypothetical protein